MTEIFENISNDTKKIAKTSWNLAMAQKDPVKAANLLNTVTEYYKNILSEEEVEFLQFYFRMQMEMMKE